MRKRSGDDVLGDILRLILLLKFRSASNTFDRTRTVTLSDMQRWQPGGFRVVLFGQIFV